MAKKIEVSSSALQFYLKDKWGYKLDVPQLIKFMGATMGTITTLKDTGLYYSWEGDESKSDDWDIPFLNTNLLQLMCRGYKKVGVPTKEEIFNVIRENGNKVVTHDTILYPLSDDFKYAINDSDKVYYQDEDIFSNWLGVCTKRDLVGAGINIFIATRKGYELTGADRWR